MGCFELLKEQLNTLCPQLDVRVDEPLERHTSFHIGGPAALMALPATREEAVLCVQTALKLGIEPFFMGNGSNLLAADEGVARFIIKSTNLRCCEVQGNVITADSGVTLARLAVFAREQGLTGLEFAHGIPGTLGGAITMNAGAYGGEMAQVVRAVDILEKNGEVNTLYNFDFGYRRSAFSDGSRMILGARLELAAGDREQIAARMEELAVQRQSKQPLEYPSAGSMFKRPEGYFAAALIDQCGLKGLWVGGAQVSEKHAGFVVNRGGATCADVLGLVEQVKGRVLDETGVTLEMEVKVLR
jgi:UDP-N-acetylmuramate dehydrogenase